MKKLFAYALCLTAIIISSCNKNQVKKPVLSASPIISFKLDKDQVGDAIIDNSSDSAKIIVNVTANTGTLSYTPDIILEPGASISPASNVKITIDINGTYVYTVTTSLGTAEKYYLIIKNNLPSQVVYKDNAVTNFFRRQTGHIASDGGFTIPLSNGKVLWLMGDSHINDFRASDSTMNWLFQVRNAGLLQPTNDWTWQHTSTLVGSDSSVPSYIKFSPDNTHWVWPGAGFQQGDSVYMYSSNLTTVGSGTFGFGSGGNDFMAVARMSDMRVMGYYQLQNFNGINFGITFIDNHDGYMYVYGNKSAFIASDIYLARFPLNNIRSKWTFWDGGGFNTDVTKAKSVGQGQSNGVSINRVNGKFIIASTEFSVGCNQGNRIFISTSDSPVGPFSVARPVYKITDTVQNDYPFFYAAIIHPEYTNSKMEMLLTYAINGYPNCLPDHDANNRSIPDRYRLRGIRIPWNVISTNYSIK